jgi:transposase InsO family protein
MPFKEKSKMAVKIEFVREALLEGANVSALCRRDGIGRTLAYKLMKRFLASGEAGLSEHSRKPHHSPRRSAPCVEAAVAAVRTAHPAWGGRKIGKVLERRGLAAPAPSTVTDILRRNGFELGQFGGGAKPFIRFEHAAPNDLWQMDFKGHVPMADGARLHPLTVLDDHSRFSIVLSACGREDGETVKIPLITAFRRFGLPLRMAMDNGPPWGDRGSQPFTRFGVWLIEQGIFISHSRPLHPQTLGKDERFHRTLKAEVLQEMFAHLAASQAALDAWRSVYNDERPHEAIGYAVPAERYHASGRQYRDAPEPWFYAQDDIVRRVQKKGEASLFGHTIKISKAFHGKDIAFRPAQEGRDGVYDAYFRHQKIKCIDLADEKR